MYVDIQFLLNFSTDLLMLFLIRSIIKSNSSLWRLMLAASIGSFAIFAIFFPSLVILHTFIGKLFTSVVIVFVAFGYHSPTVFMRNFSIFYLMFFAVGGGMYAAQSMLQTEHEMWRGILVSYGRGYGHPVTWLFLVVGWPLAWLFTRKTLHSVQARAAIHKHYSKMDVTFGDATFSCTGLVDTGNQLRDPITRAPVVIVESHLLRDILPQSYLDAFKRSDDHWSDLLDQLDDEWSRRFRMIPFRSVSKDNQLMVALKPDKVVVWKDGLPIENSKVLISIDYGHLSSDGSYSAIIHPGLFVAG